jgi:hypothetical protein
MNGSGRPEQLDERTRRRLARLADGSTRGHERAELEAMVAGSPELQAALERQRAGISALRSLDLEAPAYLRRRVEEGRSVRARPARRRRFALGGAIAGAAAGALIAVLLTADGPGEPTVIEAARYSELRPTQPSVPDSPANPKLLDAEVDGVPFPDLHEEFAWEQAGERSDGLDGRNTVTVYYQRPGQRIGYTIVSGAAIDPPADGRRRIQNGVELYTTVEDGRAIVTWTRNGRTCVLSGEGVSAADLREVASWKGDGAVPF